MNVTVGTPRGTSKVSPHDLFTYLPFGIEPNGPEGGKGFELGACTSTSCAFAGPLTEFFTQAAGNPPYLSIALTLSSVPLSVAGSGERMPAGYLKNLRLDPPPGMAFDPQAVPRCPLSVFKQERQNCPERSRVGVAVTEYLLTTGEDSSTREYLYNIEPPAGLPAEFGFTTQVLAMFSSRAASARIGNHWPKMEAS